MKKKANQNWFSIWLKSPALDIFMWLDIHMILLCLRANSQFKTENEQKELNSTQSDWEVGLLLSEKLFSMKALGKRTNTSYSIRFLFIFLFFLFSVFKVEAKTWKCELLNIISETFVAPLLSFLFVSFVCSWNLSNFAFGTWMQCYMACFAVNTVLLK